MNKETGIDKDKTKPNINFNFNYSLTYGLMVAMTIAFGIIMKLIYRLDRQFIGKISIITGLPIIRTNFFLIPLIVDCICPIFLVLYFNADPNIRSHHKNQRQLFSKTKCGFFFENVLYYIAFLINYYLLIKPMAKATGMKISGHVIAITFSGNILLNIHQICNYLNNCNTMYVSILRYTTIGIRFLLGHNLYTLFWTAWVFHEVRDLCLAFVLSFVYIFLIKLCPIDYFVLCLSKGIPLRKKYENILWSNTITD